MIWCRHSKHLMCVSCTQGRHIMWGWLQERRKVGSYDYAGCLSLPRVMYISGNHLHQVLQPRPPSSLLPTHFLAAVGGQLTI